MDLEQEPTSAQLRILGAAQVLFKARGLRAVTMDDIATSAGVSKKTIYVHFDSKQKLIEAFSRYLVAHVSEAILPYFDDFDDPLGAFEEAARALGREFVDVSPIYYHDLQRYYPEVWDEVQEAREHNFSRLKDMLSAAQERGLIKDCVNLEVTVTMYREAIRGVLNPGFLSSQSVSMPEAVATLVEVFLRGIACGQGDD